MTTKPDELVQQFLDGDLEAYEEAAALKRIAEDPEARAMLRFDLRMRAVLNEAPADPGVIPPGFTDRVMEAVAGLEARSIPAPWQGLQAAWKAFIRPRPLSWRPAYVLPLLALLMVAFFFLGRADVPSVETAETYVASSEAADAVLVRFMFVDEDASTVAVAGDFTYWEPEPLSRQVVDGQVVWTTQMAVTPGEHRYMFVIDGEQWVTDPLAPEARDDGFGYRNAILSL